MYLGLPIDGSEPTYLSMSKPYLMLGDSLVQKRVSVICEVHERRQAPALRRMGKVDRHPLSALDLWPGYL